MINPFSKTFNASELETFQFLAQTYLFARLKNVEMSRFLPALHLRKYKKDEVVFFSGDPSQAVYIVKSGKIRLTIDVKDNFEKINEVRKSEVFGENALLENVKRIYTSIVDSEEAELYVIPHFAIQEIFDSHSRIKAKMMTSLAEFYNQNNYRLFKSYKSSFGFFNLNEMFDKISNEER
ncbi:cyclic nucleotide binding protein [Indibacter alkaliphilus LW1]|uniref:Cyclic nucleotide binding protein n=1 Tax=Indibacter alkaliphilus (strain CCUG 57479 / KCTC 22604 / LW1) TaxID=1189612 RepID=S2E7K4_INDAL|nr:cyclic nucleotide-binding domain-containing protein [Indibacter alkaliphilus]EPA00597.1 cyclic nucleotide binding protein [Indibacter alkaliphilus LW1]